MQHNSFHMLPSARTIFIILLATLLQSGLFMSELAAQQSRNGDDRRSSQPSQIRAQSINISGADGSFYFVDPLGTSLLLERMDSGDLIDTDTYVLSSGDLVSVDIKGGMTGTFRGMLVSPQGVLSIPGVGSVSVAGLLLSEAQTAVQDMVNENFRDTEASLTLEHPRNIQVHVAGDVTRPGFYSLPAQTRLNTALVAALAEEPLERDQLKANLPSELVFEGPYAFRNVIIEREGEEISADLVAYKLAGKTDLNPVLKQGDVIRLNRRAQYQPQISISGSVHNHVLTEYRSDDTIESLLEMAGGFTFDANREQLKVYRYTLDGIQTIELMEEDIASFDLQPNDRVVVGFDNDLRYNQSARVTGEVNTPGIFPIVEGETTINDLLELAGGFTDKALPSAGRLIRSRPWGNINALMRTSDQLLEGFEYLEMENALPNNEVFVDLTDRDQLSQIRLYNGDQLTIPQNRETIYVFGQVMNPGYFNFSTDNSAFDFVAMAGGYSLAAEPDRTFIIKAKNNGWYKPGETTIEPGDMIFVDREPLESLALQRQEMFHRREIRNRNIQLIFSGLATITSVITAYVAIRR